MRDGARLRLPPRKFQQLLQTAFAHDELIYHMIQQLQHGIQAHTTIKAYNTVQPRNYGTKSHSSLRVAHANSSSSDAFAAINSEYSLTATKSSGVSVELVDASDAREGDSAKANTTPLRSQKARISSRALAAFRARNRKKLLIEPDRFTFFQRCHFAPWHITPR